MIALGIRQIGKANGRKSLLKVFYLPLKFKFRIILKRVKKDR